VVGEPVKRVREWDCAESILPHLQLPNEFVSQPAGYFVELLNGLGNVKPEDECGEFVEGEWFEAVAHTGVGEFVQSNGQIPNANVRQALPGGVRVC
jgi:hypothetical protein